MKLVKIVFGISITYGENGSSTRFLIAEVFERENQADNRMRELKAEINGCKTVDDFEKATGIWASHIQDDCSQNMFKVDLEQIVVHDAPPEGGEINEPIYIIIASFEDDDGFVRRNILGAFKQEVSAMDCAEEVMEKIERSKSPEDFEAATGIKLDGISEKPLKRMFWVTMQAIEIRGEE